MPDNIPQYARVLEKEEDRENVTIEVTEEINVAVGDATAADQETRPTNKGPKGINLLLYCFDIFTLIILSADPSSLS